MSFVFSADGHLVEPSTLFSEGLPPALRMHGLRAEKRDEFIYSMAGDKVLSKSSIHGGPPRLGPDGEPFGRPDRRGNREVEWRLRDMEMDGIDAEIVFPSLGLTSFMVENADAELASAILYNDWCHALLKDHRKQFVRCGILPVRDFTNTIGEMKRLADLGFTAAMLPSIIEPESGLPAYNCDVWDPVFEAAQILGIVFVLHTGTGRSNVCLLYTSPSPRD